MDNVYEKCNPFKSADPVISDNTQSTEVSSDEEKCYSSSDYDMESGAPSLTRKMSKLESSWKRKVKTELCKFWLNGLQCENQNKE